MKEQLYTIPVNDAFDADCECPMCRMYKDLEDHAIEYTLGPSYMEDDVRATTDEMGFCRWHIRKLYEQKNRLGLALILKTHMDKTLKDLKSASMSKPSAGGLFKKSSGSAVGDYVRQGEKKCFVCDHINRSYPRYVDTIFYLWKKDPQFVQKFKNCKGFCVHHYGELYDTAPEKLKDKDLHDFLSALDAVFFAGAERVNDDLEWFIQKYDYRNQDAPWKNSKDAIPRTIIKSNDTILEDEQSKS